MSQGAVNPGVLVTYGGGLTHLCPRPRRLQTSRAAPLPGMIPKAGGGTSARPTSTEPQGLKTAQERTPAPPGWWKCWDPTVPQGCSLREGSPVSGAGLLALGQSRCPGEPPPRGTQSCRHLAARRRGEAEGKGGPSRCWRAPQLAHFPISGGRRDWAAPPPRSSTLQRAGCKSRASVHWGRTRAAAGNTAAARSSVAAGPSAAQPASLTWSPLPLGRGRPGWGRLAGWTPASPAPHPVAGELTCTRGWRDPVRRLPAPTTSGECLRDTRPCHPPTVH